MFKKNIAVSFFFFFKCLCFIHFSFLCKQVIVLKRKNFSNSLVNFHCIKLTIKIMQWFTEQVLMRWGAIFTICGAMKMSFTELKAISLFWCIAQFQDGCLMLPLHKFLFSSIQPTKNYIFTILMVWRNFVSFWSTVLSFKSKIWSI